MLLGGSSSTKQLDYMDFIIKYFKKNRVRTFGVICWYPYFKHQMSFVHGVGLISCQKLMKGLMREIDI